MATFTNPLTFPHLLLYLSKYSMDDMQQVYKSIYEKNMFWSSIPEDFIKMAAIPEKIISLESKNIKDHHNALPIILERNKWNALGQKNVQPNKIEYNIFNTWTVLQNVQVKGILLVSEIYSPDYILVSFLPLNYSLITGNTLNLSTITINTSSGKDTVNQMELGNEEISISNLINKYETTEQSIGNIDPENLRAKIKEYIKNIKNITPMIYKVNHCDNSDSASIPIEKEKLEEKKQLKRSIIL